MLVNVKVGKLDKKTAFKDVRQLLADSKVKDYNDAFRLMYDNLDKFAEGNLAACILALADGQIADSQVVDKEINFMSTMIKLLGEIS